MGEGAEAVGVLREGSGRMDGMHAWTIMFCMALWLRQKEDEVPRRERAEIAMGVSFRVKVRGGLRRVQTHVCVSPGARGRLAVRARVSCGGERLSCGWELSHES